MIEEEDFNKLSVIEEILRAIEGIDLYDLVKAIEICLVLNIVVPKKLKVLEFAKYIGTQCLMTHLKVHYNKMAKVVHDEKLLIHFF